MLGVFSPVLSDPFLYFLPFLLPYSRLEVAPQIQLRGLGSAVSPFPQRGEQHCNCNHQTRSLRGSKYTKNAFALAPDLCNDTHHITNYYPQHYNPFPSHMGPSHSAELISVSAALSQTETPYVLPCETTATWLMYCVVVGVPVYFLAFAGTHFSDTRGLIVGELDFFLLRHLAYPSPNSYPLSQKDSQIELRVYLGMQQFNIIVL